MPSLIVDAHAHLGDGEQGGAYIRSLPIDRSLALSRKIGIRAVVASSLKALISSTTSANQLAATLARAATATSVRMTVTVVVVLPVMLVYPFFQRFFTKGIMIGAVKG